MSTYYEDEDLLEKEKMYPELAKANLFRIRGEYKGAIEQCLSILKRFPDDHDAHVLIADIYAEQGDLMQAAQWYELAIDLTPDSKSDREKLAQLKRRINDREAASAAQQLGLPPEKPPVGLYIGIIAVIAIAVAIGSFLLGQRVNTSSQAISSPKVSSPINAVTNAVAPVDDSPPVGGSSSVASLIEEDRMTQQALQGFMPNGTILMSAMQDPRNRGLVITASARPEDNERLIAADVARAALGQFSSAPGVIVRLVKYGRLALVATVSRDRLAALDSVGSDPTAIANAILTEEWSSVKPITTPAPVAGPSDTPQ
jgi:hypothetical protein